MHMIKGAFESDCSFRPKGYCAGELEVKLDGNFEDGCTGTCTIKYVDAEFKPPIWIPNPLPSMPVVARKCVRVHGHGEQYDLIVKTSWLMPWQKIFDLVGLRVKFEYDGILQTFVGRYTVDGGIGIPKDAGSVHAYLCT